MDILPEQLITYLSGMAANWTFDEIVKYLELDINSARAVLDLLTTNPNHPLLLNIAVLSIISKLVVQGHLSITEAQKKVLTSKLGAVQDTFRYLLGGIATIPVTEQ